MPEGCDLMQAGGLPIAFGTSHVGLVYRAKLKAGQVGLQVVFNFLCFILWNTLDFIFGGLTQKLMQVYHLKELYSRVMKNHNGGGKFGALEMKLRVRETW